MCESIFKIQEYITESKSDVTKVLELLQTKLTGFEMTLREIMVLTAVTVAQKAEILKLTADTNLQASLSISKDSFKISFTEQLRP